MSKESPEQEFADVVERLSLLSFQRPSDDLRRRILQLEQPASQPALSVSLSCTFCHDTLERRLGVFCAACLAPHHPDCFEQHGVCSAPGCGESRVVEPQAGPRRRRKWPLALLAAGLGLGLGAAAFSLSDEPRLAVVPEPTPTPSLPQPPATGAPEPPTPKPKPPAPEPIEPEPPVASQAGDVLERLDADYKRLLALESPRHQATLEDARATLLAATQSGWEYREAALALRNARSPAALPLLLYCLYERGPKTSWIYSTELLRVLALLSGDRFPQRTDTESAQSLALRLATTWWEPGKDTLTTDLGEMKSARLWRVVEELLRRAARDGYDPMPQDPGQDEPSNATCSSMIGTLRAKYRISARAWLVRGDLHARMVPMLLERAQDSKLTLVTVPLLARLWSLGHRAQLAEPAQNASAGARVAAALARWSQGESLDEATLVDVARSEPNIVLRGQAIIALGWAKGAVALTLVGELLSDPNERIREAAGMASKRSGRVEVSALEGVLVDSTDAEARRAAAKSLARVPSRASQAALARGISALLAKPPEDRALLVDVVRAFSTASGEIFAAKDSHKYSYYLAEAQRALAWWETQTKKE